MFGTPADPNASAWPPQSDPDGELFQPDDPGLRRRSRKGAQPAGPGLSARENLGNGTRGLAQPPGRQPGERPDHRHTARLGEHRTREKYWPDILAAHRLPL